MYFERKVASELAAFAETLPASGKALWLVREGERTQGSLAIDGDRKKRVAHLRWFIIGDARRRTARRGVGRALMWRARWPSSMRIQRDLSLDLQESRRGVASV